MNSKPDPAQEDDDLPAEVDFNQGVRGKFFATHAKLNLPIYLDEEVQAFLSALATKKGVDMSDIANDLLKKDIALLDVCKRSTSTSTATGILPLCSKF